MATPDRLVLPLASNIIVIITGAHGRITGIGIYEGYTQYRVLYYKDNERKEEWFYDHELATNDTDRTTVGFHVCISPKE